jgi:hypothetical protein
MLNWKGFGRKRSDLILRHYPDICLEGLEKAMKTLSQDSRFSDRDLNLGPPKYEAGVLTNHDVRSERQNNIIICECNVLIHSLCQTHCL